ncbi:MAG: serine/threonine protein kinase [Planctomycetota bacterium]|nr:MAG: serine/threonine protein kinase [Planctomycetota bacterium]REJ90984.1 MAG: serine/threonine protein kinase [Planctomycetota bacterium]REK25467.1 MAG: serine/threonine protein kinase [Planctomycetota bacterium]REK40830.1 MAG: serine/threonine protein kinase [Planctomycetota bacterium]
MVTTTLFREQNTLTYGGEERTTCSDELLHRYRALLENQRFSWTDHHHLRRRLGAGGQGVVYLTDRRGTDNFTLPVALKIFSPERYDSDAAYDEAMARIAATAARVAQIQQDNLLDVHNFVERNRIRMMEMEWIDGYDLARLLTTRMLDLTYHRVSSRRWEYMNNVIVTAGPVQPRLKPGVAVAILRDLLAALAALHRGGVVHGDIKPSNIMLKRTGNAKLVDIGSAFEMENVPVVRTCTPTYAAPEVLEGGEYSERSDLASLGYVLVELLAGRPLFGKPPSYRELLEAKRMLPHQLPRILPQDVVCNELLMNFCRGLVAPDPARRFPSAEAADLMEEGAACFLRQLVVSNLSSEYDNEIRLWLEELE